MVCMHQDLSRSIKGLFLYVAQCLFACLSPRLPLSPPTPDLTLCRLIRDDAKLAQFVKVLNCLFGGRRFDSSKNSKNRKLKSTFENIKLPAELRDYFLRSNKRNINQTVPHTRYKRQSKPEMMVTQTKPPPKWQENDLVSGGHGQAGSWRGQ